MTKYSEQERETTVRQLLDALDLNSADHDNSVRKALAELVDTREEIAEIAELLGGDTDCYDSLKDHVRSAVARLREQIGEARKDSERLDFLQSLMRAGDDTDHHGFQVEETDDGLAIDREYWQHASKGEAHGRWWTSRLADAPTLREAIDAARLAHPSQSAVESPLPQTTESSNG
jgi:hypothetical protein